MVSHPPTTDVRPPEADASNPESIRSYPSLTFTLPTPESIPRFGPRTGKLVLTRPLTSNDPHLDLNLDLGLDHHHQHHDESTVTIEMDTPNILVGTSRGVVPHFSRDHTKSSDAIRWINVPFESFLEQVPPIPTLQTGTHPLHRFLGFDTRRHMTSLCLRNPMDTREMPPNGNTYVSANCVRGVRKVTTTDWRNYVYKMQPDIVFALADTPFTLPPHSQKRVTKSIERSAAWVADILRPVPGYDTFPSPDRQSHTESRITRHPLNIFVHMAGGTSLPAREAFAYGLREKLHGLEAAAVKPLQCLDDGITGYSFDLAVLRGIKPGPNTSHHQCLPDDFLRQESPEMLQHPEEIADALTPIVTGNLSPVPSSASSMAEPPIPPKIECLLRASLGELPESKPRLVTGVRSPHEMLRLIRDVGVDIFDAGWAMNAANLGVALDFVFPVPPNEAVGTERKSLGHNLYDTIYAHGFGRLADNFYGAGENAEVGTSERLVCPCIACSPRSPSSHIQHSAIDKQSHDAVEEAAVRYEKPYSRAYIHHLLHTHEMSAHTLLVAHNLAVVSAFLAGVRGVLVEGGEERMALEVERFESAYDESGELFNAAKENWEFVDKARGKGRLAREKGKQEENGEDE